MIKSKLKEIFKNELYILLVLVIFFLAYELLAWHGPSSSERWYFSYVSNRYILGIDDAWRYFLTRSAWHDISSWAFMFVLPADMLFMGIMHFITNDNVFLMRSITIALNIIGVYYIYKICVIFEIRKIISVVACIFLLIMPLFITVSMSFLGEALLTPLYILSVYFLIKGNFYRMAFFAALVTMAQPQGLFLIIPLFFYLAVNKKYSVAIYTFGPGFIYFLLLLLTPGGLYNYFLYGLSIVKLYDPFPAPAIDQLGFVAPLVNFNPLFVMGGLAGFLLILRNFPTIRWKMLALISGVLLLLAFLAYEFHLYPLYEPRLLLPIVPIFVVACAYTIEALTRLFSKYRFVSTIPVCIFLLLAAENIAQSDPIRMQVMSGQRFPFGHLDSTILSFNKSSLSEKSLGADVSIRIKNFFDTHKEYKLLVIGDPNIFYDLDPNSLPPGTRACYMYFQPAWVLLFFHNKYLCVSGDSPRVRFYYLYPKESNAGSAEDKGVLVMGENGIVAPWKVAYFNDMYKVYEITYNRTDPPEYLYYPTWLKRKYSKKQLSDYLNYAKDRIGQPCEGDICSRPEWNIDDYR